MHWSRMPLSDYAAIRWRCQSACAKQAHKVYQTRMVHISYQKRV